MADINEMDRHELPWLIFTLCGNAYAVNSKFVSGILMPPEVTPLPEAADIYKGLVDIRGDVFPLLEVRKLFKFKTIEEECTDFNNMINGAREAHINWVNELKRYVNEKDAFLLPTEPTKCAFGKWYNDYSAKVSNASAAVSLSKIKEPHEQFHEAADNVIKLVKNDKDGNNDLAIKESLALATERYVPIILALLDETKQVYRSSYRETVVTLSNGEDTLGLLLDEILGVDKVEMVADDRSMSKIVDSRFFTGVGHNDKINKEILIVDEEMLLKKAKI